MSSQLDTRVNEKLNAAQFKQEVLDFDIVGIMPDGTEVIEHSQLPIQAGLRNYEQVYTMILLAITKTGVSTKVSNQEYKLYPIHRFNEIVVRFKEPSGVIL